MLNQKRTRKQPLRNKDKSNNKRHRTNKKHRINKRQKTNKTRQRRNTRQELGRLLPSFKFLDSEEAGKFSFKLN